MNKQLLEFIQTLSKSDKKTLIGKALKTSEEVGELAKAVLPYENAAGTQHRFVEKKQILDSTADVILCALSIAYDLGYSDQDITDMMGEKAKKWSGLQAKEAKGQFPLPFEIHVTIDFRVLSNIDNEIENFKDACSKVKVKPIILDLEKDRDIVMIDVMTSSVHYGDNTTAQIEAERISDELKAQGYKVLRVKIETVPWHPAAPSVNDKEWIGNDDNYFESHLRIVTTKDRKDELEEIAKEHNAHLSRNYFKKLNDDQYIIMMTLREYDETSEYFSILVQKLKDDLEIEGFVVDKAEIEYALFDTNTKHDSVWISNVDEDGEGF